MQHVLSLLRKAVQDFDMIADGDTIAVGVSGGKDSMLLLTALAQYRRFSQQKFQLIAINIDMGFKNLNPTEVAALQKYIAELDVPFYIEKTDIAAIIFDVRQEKSPCSLCAKMRRGALCSKCVELKAGKLALAHHADDVLETMLLSFFYESRFSSFAPKSLMARTGVTVIRPLIYLEEHEVVSAVKSLNLPVLHNPCPSNHYTQREYMKNLVKQLDHDLKGAKRNMLSAIMHPERGNLDSYKK